MNNILNAKETFDKLIKETQIVIMKDDYNDIIEAINKQIPRMPLETQELMDIEWLCPICMCTVGDCVNVDNYCFGCGQKISF